MANLIVAKDVQTGEYTQVSEAWLDRFPGEFQKVRDALDPITQEELDAEKTAIEQAAEARTAEIAEAAASAQPAKTTTPAPAGSSSPTDTSDSSGFTGRSR